METLAFTHSYVTYENLDAEPKLISLEELGLKVPSSAWIGLAGLAVAVSVMAIPAEAHAAYVSTNGGRLNVRCGPGIAYCVDYKLHNGSHVKLTGRYKHGWAQVAGGGWVASQWLSYGKVSSSSYKHKHGHASYYSYKYKPCDR